MGFIVRKKPPPNPKKLCKRCGGSGQLLRTTNEKVLHFKKCSDCRGHGVRFIDHEKLPD